MVRDDRLEILEFLVRVEATQGGIHSSDLPDVPGWIKTNAAVDSEMKVRYATYSKIVEQKLSPDGPDLDVLASASAEVSKHLEANIHWDFNRMCYEKRVYLVTQPLASWFTEQES